MDPFALSVSTLIMQTIEHVDTGGYFGNFIDILQLLSHESAQREYEEDRLTVFGRSLIANRRMAKLFVPPEHRKRIQPVLHALRAIGERS